jgi:hypothetical protein
MMVIDAIPQGHVRGTDPENVALKDRIRIIIGRRVAGAEAPKDGVRAP